VDERAGVDEPPSACLVTTTVDDRAAADSIATSAVTGGLAACAQVGGPITSTYRWRGAVETAQEYVVQFKTAADRADALVAHVRREHPYEVPEVVVTPVTGGNPGYLAWVLAETRAAGQHPGPPG
jgi:periplasmic divalent cation tolerance protein